MEILDDLIDFLGKSVTKYHFLEYTANLFKKRKLAKVEISQLESDDVPQKGFLVINRSTIIAYELGTVDKSLIFSSSIRGKALNIFDSNDSNENGLIKCLINDDSNKNSELLNAYDYMLAGEVVIKNKMRQRPYLFKSDKPVGIIENNSAFLSLSEDSINSYLENNFKIPIRESEIIEKNLFLIPYTQSFDSTEDIFFGSCSSLINLSNLSTIGVSYLILKAFLASLGNCTFNKFIIISSNESDISTSQLTSLINLILSSKGTSLNSETLNFNVGGIESCWSSHFPSSSSKFLSKGIVIQNFQQNDIILNKLAKFGIPIFFDNDLEIDYSINQRQIIQNDGKMPAKISLPLFNYNQIIETASISDIFNIYNSLYEMCMI